MRFLLLALLSACASRDSFDDAGSTDTFEPPVVTSPPAPPDPDAVSVSVHPEVATMLVVTWTEATSAEQVWLSWTVDGAVARSSATPAPAGPVRRVVLGVPADTAVDDLQIHTVRAGAETVRAIGSAVTGSLPDDLDDAVLVTTPDDPARMRPEPWLLTSVDVGPIPFWGPCYTVVVDATGRIVWYRASEGTRLTWQTKVSRAGDALLVDEVMTYTSQDPALANVTRITLDLAVDERIVLPAMNTFDELDDGSLVWSEAETNLDYHLVRRHPDGTDERLWSCRPWMQSYSEESWACATNVTRWEPARGTVLWSTFETGIVLEISLETGEIVREYGPFPGGYRFEPPGSTFDRQHMPGFTDDGTLLVSTHDGERQVAREYAIDDEALVIAPIHEIETPDFARYGGEIRPLPSGNRLWQLGTTGVVQEVTGEGEVVWRVEWPGHLVGNTTPIADLYALTRPGG